MILDKCGSFVCEVLKLGKVNQLLHSMIEENGCLFCILRYLTCFSSLCSNIIARPRPPDYVVTDKMGAKEAYSLSKSRSVNPSISETSEQSSFHTALLHEPTVANAQELEQEVKQCAVQCRNDFISQRALLPPSLLPPSSFLLHPLSPVPPH